MQNHHVLTVLAAVGLTAGATPASSPMSPFSQASLPDAVKVPSGHRVVMEVVGAGDITYECRVKKDMADQFEWAFSGPDALLKDRKGQQVGKYFGPPATWENRDGSKVTGAQLAVAPAGTGDIPSQLVKANPVVGEGAMRGVTYIQRVNTRGGVAPSSPCAASNVGQKQSVRYQADYIFWRAL